MVSRTPGECVEENTAGLRGPKGDESMITIVELRFGGYFSKYSFSQRSLLVRLYEITTNKSRV